MIKKNWKKIVIIMIIIIISMSIGAYAADYLLNATQVSQNKNGTTVTVKEALDDLYSKVPYNQGDLVKLKGDTSGDTFYVLYESKDTMEIFAKTNINRDTCATQANDVLGNTACAFSSACAQGIKEFTEENRSGTLSDAGLIRCNASKCAL